MKLDLLRKRSFEMALLWLGVIWTLSSIPGDEIPSINYISVDKLAHIGVYGILGLLMNLWLSKKKSEIGFIRIVYMMLALNACLDEYHQNFIPGRSVNILDLFANWIGLALPYYLAVRNARRR